MMMMMTTAKASLYSLSQACGCQCVSVTRPEDGGGNCRTAYRGRLWCYTQDISGSVYCQDSQKSNKSVSPPPVLSCIPYLAMQACTGLQMPASPLLLRTNCARLW